MKRVFVAATMGAAAIAVATGVADAGPGEVSDGDPNVIASMQVRQIAFGTDIAAGRWVLTPPAAGIACYWGYVAYPGHDADGKPYAPWTDTVRVVGPAGWTGQFDPGALIETNCYLHRAEG
ncbi:hypothetical protein ACFXHA_43870 [Nocardia sp. NPDC059240]|uniref:hypothetical protein n=1 Tax=Nocardia sp. NPDC059240 TaxID=3346786 RepID=UPI00367DB659